MKKIFAFVVVAMLMLAIPAAAANYKLTGQFDGGYKYSAGVGEDTLNLYLNFSFDEAGIMTAYAPINLAGGFGIASGWWVKFATEPLNVIISDNSATGYKWSALESTFGLLYGNPGGNRYSKVWGTVAPGLKYAAQVAMDDSSVAPALDKYGIAGQLAADLPLGLKLTLDLGLLNDGTYHAGEALALTGAVPVIGGNFKVAVGNFADLDSVLGPEWPITAIWGADDLQAFGAYAGVTGIGIGPVTLDEVSYKMGMGNVDGALLATSTGNSFYELGLQEATVNASAKFAPLSIAFKNAVWFESFNINGGYNANLDVEAGLGDLVLGLNLDSKLNWATLSGMLWGWNAELRADYEGAIGALGGVVGYNSNWEGVGQYVIDEAEYGADMVYASLYYDAPFGLHLEAFGDYNQKGTDEANAGLYAKYENTYTTVPYVVDLKTLVAGRFGFT